MAYPYVLVYHVHLYSTTHMSQVSMHCCLDNKVPSRMPDQANIHSRQKPTVSNVQHSFASKCFCVFFMICGAFAGACQSSKYPHSNGSSIRLLSAAMSSATQRPSFPTMLHLLVIEFGNCASEGRKLYYLSCINSRGLF